MRKGVNVTIEPGTELRFAKGKHLVVLGTLNARGTPTQRIRFTRLTDTDAVLLAGFNRTAAATTATQATTSLAYDHLFRLVEGESSFEGKLQVFFNAKWHYVCSTQFK